MNLPSGLVFFLDFQYGTDKSPFSAGEFRDYSAWYHIIFVYDSTNGTAADRVKLYVNGVRVTAFASASYPNQNVDGHINNNVAHQIGRQNDLARYFDGYMAEINFIDGTALTPTSFGETGAFGEWMPIEYAGAYGTNGFHLNFSGEGTMLATGGSIATDGDYKVHSFTSSGTFTPTIVPGTKAFVEYLVIGGGGGGSAGGGGAGGYRTGYLDVVQGTGLTVTIGAGGNGAGAASRDGYQGVNSVFQLLLLLEAVLLVAVQE